MIFSHGQIITFLFEAKKERNNINRRTLETLPSFIQTNWEDLIQSNKQNFHFEFWSILERCAIHIVQSKFFWFVFISFENIIFNSIFIKDNNKIVGKPPNHLDDNDEKYIWNWTCLIPVSWNYHCLSQCDHI